MSPEARQHYEVNPPAALLEVEQTRARWFSGLIELTKPRLSFLSVITALVAYLAAQPGRDFWNLFNFLCGTALSAGGAAALNQWLERHTDAVMKRTRDRPLPTGLVTPAHAFGWGLLLSSVGVSQLWLGTNSLAGMLGLGTIVSYVCIYTPLKRRSRWATELGAVSGALPPLIGWAAAEGSISTLGWILFGVLFFWQIPHFMAIAWVYRKDYAAVSFPMLSVTDPDGGRVALWSMINAILLIAVSLLPTLLGFTSIIYLMAAAALGLWFLLSAGRFMKEAGRDSAARRLFLTTIAYLPLVLAILVLDRWLA
ncbi:MAG: heme o synthase [Opitutaceae bacterium]